jgi:cell division transport system permease protein
MKAGSSGLKMAGWWHKELMMLPSAVQRAFIDVASNKYLHAVCIITIALSVFIVSAFALFYINVTDFLDAWKKGIRTIVYLNDGVTQQARTELIGAVGKFEGVAEIGFVSKDSALKNLKEKIGQQSALLEGIDENPLPDSLEIILSGTSRKLADLEKLANDIRALPHVQDVEYAQKWLNRFTGVYNLFQVTGLVLAALFFIATLLIVANTIRIIMYTRRKEIEIMRIVGADEAFIKYPFYIESLMQGFLGGFIGLLLLYLSYRMTMSKVEQDAMLSFFEIKFIPATFLLAIVACSMIIGWMGCLFSIRKFLKF